MANARKTKPSGPTPPSHLSEGSRALWLRLVDEYGMAEDVAGLAILTSGLEAFDRADQARKVLDAEGLTVRGDRGGVKCHPAAAIERDSRAAFLSAMKAMRFDLEPTRDAPGRPPGR